MRPDDRVSIVIPCYNSEQWVGEAVDSALAQIHRCEVIVIDDGSSDRSVDVLRRYGNRIRWETGPNRGGCAARNRGVELATGSWIQFLDADDVLLPECVAAKLRHVSDPHLVPCTRIVPMDGPERQKLPPHWLRASYSLDEMLRDGTPATNAPLHRKEHLLRVGGFRVGLSCAQEFELHLRLAITLGLRFAPLGVDGALSRATPGSVSRSAGPRMLANIAEVLLDAHGWLAARPDLAESRHSDAIAQRVTRLARILWGMGQSEHARTLVRRARTISPAWQRHAYQSKGAERIARLIGFETFEHIRHALRRVRSSPAYLGS